MHLVAPVRLSICLCSPACRLQQRAISLKFGAKDVCNLSDGFFCVRIISQMWSISFYFLDPSEAKTPTFEGRKNKPPFQYQKHKTILNDKSVLEPTTFGY